jgi:4'-phosphopantetheinyl transferase
VHLSLGRAPGLVVVAVSTAGPVGVDVEPAGRAGFPGFEDVAAHPQEEGRDPTLTWVRKEAVLKATGWGLAIDPRGVRLDDGPRLVSWDERLPAPARCWLHDLPLTHGYVGAVAVIRPTETLDRVPQDSPSW